MQNLREFIHEKRPTLTPASVNTYDSILRNTYKRVFPGDTLFHVEKFNEAEKFLEHLKDVPSNKRKTTLSALFVVSKDNAYRALMMEDIHAYQAEIGKQEKTPSQEANWVSQADIKEVWNQLKDEATFLYKKKTLTPKDIQTIQNFVILSVTSGIFIPPRRSLDFCAFKIRNVDPSKENFMRDKSFVFTTYKTFRTYGTQVVPIPAALRKIIVKWETVNEFDFLFADSKGKPLTNVTLNQRLNAMFGGKKIGVNALRHSYLSEKYKGTIKTQEALEKDMTAMGSSTNVSKNYIKRAGGGGGGGGGSGGASPSSEDASTGGGF